MKKSRALKGRALFALIGVVSMGVIGMTYWAINPFQSSKLGSTRNSGITKSQVAEVIGQSISAYRFPTSAEMAVNNKEKVPVKVKYSIDSNLQHVMENLFHSYNPDYGAFVAIDPATGKVLAMVSYVRDNAELENENFALRASFPSASVFKVVTATAAIENHKISGDTVIPFNGRKHTLYRGQILKSAVTRWTHFITFKEAFARSVNTVFGRVGAYTVGFEGLRLYADRFGFDHKISADMPIQEGHAHITNDAWSLAESASGFTKGNTMSPIQGALIAASVANDGVMMEPYIVESLESEEGQRVYSAQPKVASVAMERTTAREIRTLMKETVLHGTSRGSFRGFFRRGFSLLDVGGKTGSLTGYDPRGKYDWFVGYADNGPQRIAVAALTIHEKQWRVKSSYLARRAFESYFKDSARPAKNVAQK
jgi:cell division protein FtsI/penicillin-binding protein 2